MTYRAPGTSSRTAPKSNAPKRIAMWSGPRNISTAMMRAFENRADCKVMDEPFYACWLQSSGADHPMRADILNAHDSDPLSVAQSLLAPLPGGVSLSYQKHMAHHMADIPLGDWMDGLTHIFLLRDPRRMLASYVKKHPTEVSPETLGFPQMLDIYTHLTARCGPPLVIHSEDILRAPEPSLSALCQAVGIAFDPAMLSWPAGRRSSDGIWAAHWYDAVIASTGFQPFDATLPDLPPHLARVAEACMPLYMQMAARADKGA